MCCLLLQLQRISAHFRHRLTLWPAGAFQSRRSAPLAERGLMNHPGGEGCACPSEPSSLLPDSARLSFTAVAQVLFCWATAFSPELEGSGGATNSCGERRSTCWDLHGIEEPVELAELRPMPRLTFSTFVTIHPICSMKWMLFWKLSWINIAHYPENISPDLYIHWSVTLVSGSL